MTQPKNEYLPLTQMQHGVFVASSASAGDDPYILQVMADLAEPLDRDRLSRAVDDVVGAHPAVRACFRTRRTGEPVQIVVPAVHVPHTHDDLTATRPELVAQRLEAIRQEDAAAAFDLSVSPLLRFRLIDLPGGRQHLLLSLHHIVMDGWSLPVFVNEVLSTYAGTEPSPEFVFREYLSWEAQADTGAAHEAFTGVLDTFSGPSMIAEDVLDGEPGEGTTVWDLSTAETAALVEWCQRQEVSFAAVVEACWSQVVALQTGRTDVVFGVMESNRSLAAPGIAKAIGLFANVVPVRVDLDRNGTVADLCDTLADQRLQTLEHRYMSVGRIQAARGGAPLFDTIVTVQNYRSSGDAAGQPVGGASGVNVVAARTHTPTTQPAMLAVIPGDAVRVELTYRTEVVTAPRAQAIVTAFARLLSTVPRCSDVAVRAWPLVPDDGRSDGDSGGDSDGDSDGAFDGDSGGDSGGDSEDDSGGSGRAPGSAVPRGLRTDAPALPAALVTAAKQYRDRPALSTSAGTISYGTLFEDAFALSRRLIDEFGVAPGVVVSVDLEGPAVAVTARLAVLLAGGTVGDLTADGTRPSVRLTPVGAAIVVEDVRPGRGDRPGPVAGPDGDAGHTPSPTSAGCAVAEYVDRITLSHNDIVSSDSAASWVVLSALTRGAHVVLREDASGETLRSAAHRGTTVLDGSAAALGHLARLDPAALRGRRVVVNGPPPTRSTANAIRASGAELWLAYAPAGELVSLAPVSDRPSHPAIGVPVAGLSLTLLEPHGRAVPDGSLGEITVLTDGRTRRTGDLGRRMPSGEIHYLGPVETRLEVFGKRIEPWMIEEVLADVPGVVEAAVHRAGDSHSQHLVAHVSPVSADVAALSQALRRRLPGHATPIRIATWPRLPRTSGGSVDVSTLTERTTDEPAATDDVGRLVGLFGQVTGAADVGPHSDFFAIGGDSIGVTRLRSSAKTQHGWDLDLRVILERRTPSAIVDELLSSVEASTDASFRPAPAKVPEDQVPRRAAELEREGALTGTQASLWLLNQLDLESSGYNLTLALDLAGDLDEPSLAAAVDDVAGRHEILRTTYRVKEGAPVQRVEAVPSHRPLLTVVDTPAEVLDLALAASAARGFRLDDELPMRVELHRVAPGRATLLFTFHHVAIDGASFAPFARELEHAYRARSVGEPPTFATSPVQYLDYAGWQERRLGDSSVAGTRAARQASFWESHLEGLPASTGIPADPAGPGDEVRRGTGRLLLEWDPDVRDAVGRTAARAGTTRFAVYQTALAAAMYSLGAPTDLALGSPVSVRPLVDLDDAVGNYSNFLVSRIRLDPNVGLSENCARRGDALVDELDHQDLPFSDVVRAVKAPRQPGRNPLYQTALALQSYDKPVVHLEGITVTERLMPVVDARIDLVVAVVEGGPGEGVVVSAEYAWGAYTAETVQTLAGRLRGLLIGAAGDPDLPIALQIHRIDGATAAADDVRLRPGDGLAPTRSDSSSPPQGSEAVAAEALLAEVLAAYGRAIPHGEIDPDVGYFDAGGDSVSTVRVAAALARHQVDIAVLMTGPSARGLADRIAQGEFRSGSGAPSSVFAGVDAAGYDVDLLDPFSTILPIRPGGTERPLFTFHGGVGLAIPYTGLAGVIDNEIPIYGLQSTASIFGAAQATSMTEQVHQYLAEIRRVQPHGPYRLLGWSYGGWSAHEAARLLEASGEAVELLVIIDSEVPVEDERSWGPALPREAVIRAFTSVLGITAEDGTDVTTDEQLYRAFQRTDGAFTRLSADDVRRFVDLIQNHATLARGHHPGTVAAPTVLFWSASIGTRHPAELSDGWAPFLSGAVSTVSLEAQHQFLMHPLPQRVIGTVVNDLMRDPGRAQLLAQPRYREEFEVLDYLVEPAGSVEEEAAPPVSETHEGPGETRPAGMGRFDGLLVETSTLVWRRLHHLRKTPWRLISVALNPLILIIALGYLYADAILIPGYNGAYMSYLLAGVSAQAALQNIGPTAIAIRADLDKGLFDRFRSLPIGRGVVLFAHSVADSIIGVVGLLIVVLGGFLAGWRLQTDVAGLLLGLLILVVFTYTCVWIGIGVGLSVKSLESIESIGVTLSVGLSFLSNALLAPATLPGWLQPFAEWNPVSAVSSAVRHAWGNPTAEAASVAGRFPLLAAALFCAIVLLVVPALSQRRYRKSS